MKKIVLFLSSLFLLSSCSNIFNSLQDSPKEEKKYKVTVLVQNEAETETINNARNAFPVFKEDSNIDFNIVCYPTAEGKNSANKKVLPYTGNRVEVSLSAGNWSVYCYRLDKTRKENCFESEPVNIVLTEENPSATVKLIEKPVILYDSTVENTLENAVKLPIKVDSSITQVKATWVRSGATCTEILTPESGVYYLKLIPAGASNPYNGTYNVTFDFYGTGTLRPLLYSVTEIVTVYPYCTTTTWSPAASGLEYFSQDESGNWIMDITNSCISKYKLTTFYVDPNATTNNENPSGDYFDPFTTLKDAVDAANKNTTASECTIKIRKGTTCNLASAVTVNGNLTIESYSKNASDFTSPIILKTYTNTDEVPMITASSGKTLTMNGITIDGNKNKVIDGKTVSKGSGIKVLSGGSLSITDTKIQNCKATNGAGIFCAGTITFGDEGKVEIKDNTATSEGPGIYYSNSATKLTLNSTLDTTDEVYFNFGSEFMSLSSNITKNVPVKFFGTNRNTIKVLDNSSTTDYVASSFSKFTVSGDWYIDPDGYLTQTQSIMVNTTRAPTSGTYGVSTVKEIMKMKEWVDSGNSLSGVTITLTKDITMPTLAPDEYFEGIGLYSNPFKGTFDGNSKTISNLKVNRGLFVNIATGAYIKNLKISGTGQRGALVNLMQDGTIDTCTSSVTIIAPVEEINCGGIVNSIQSGTIINCVNRGSLSGGRSGNSSAGFGGIAGKVDIVSGKNVTIQNCTNSGAINYDQKCGGIVGYLIPREDNLICSITDCENYGALTASQCVGGIVGNESVNCTSVTIDKCTNNSSITCSTLYAGGLVGYNYGVIRNSCNKGAINSSGSSCLYVGGITGNTTKSSKILNCYNSSNVYGKQLVGGIAGQIDSDGVSMQNCVVYGCTISGNSRTGQIIGNYSETSIGPIKYNYFQASGASPTNSQGIGYSNASGFDNLLSYFTYSSGAYTLGQGVALLEKGQALTSLKSLINGWVQQQPAGIYKQ